MTTIALSELDQAVVDHLTGLTVDGHVRPVGYAEVPDGAGWQDEAGNSPFSEYLIVWPLPASYSPTMADRHTIADGDYQLKAVSVVPGSARAIADAARDRMLDGTFTPPAGRSLVQVYSDGASGPTLDRDVVPELVYATEIIVVETVPA